MKYKEEGYLSIHLSRINDLYVVDTCLYTFRRGRYHGKLL